MHSKPESEDWVVLRLGHLCRLVLSTMPLLASSAQAQVDWSDLLGEKSGPPAVETPRAAPQREDTSPPSLQPAERRRSRVRAAAKARATPEPVRQTGKLRVFPPAARHEPDPDREYPAVPTQRRR